MVGVFESCINDELERFYYILFGVILLPPLDEVPAVVPVLPVRTIESMSEPLREVGYQCVDLGVAEGQRFIRLSHWVRSATCVMSGSRLSSVMVYPGGTYVETMCLPFSSRSSSNLSWLTA